MVGVNVMCCAILAFGLVFSATGGVGLEGRGGEGMYRRLVSFDI